MSIGRTRELTISLLLPVLCVVAAGGRAEAAPPADTPLEVGQVVGDFTLPDLEGRQHSLLDRRSVGPVVLVFFRGAW